MFKNQTCLNSNIILQRLKINFPISLTFINNWSNREYFEVKQIVPILILDRSLWSMKTEVFSPRLYIKQLPRKYSSSVLKRRSNETELTNCTCLTMEKQFSSGLTFIRNRLPLRCIFKWKFSHKREMSIFFSISLSLFLFHIDLFLSFLFGDFLALVFNLSAKIDKTIV